MLSAVALLPALAAHPPVELTRERAAELARAELADPAYHPPDDPLVLRALRWLLDRAGELVDRVGSASPGGWLGLLGLAVVLVAVIAVVRWRLGPVGRAGGVRTPLFTSGESTVTAAEHRRRAERAEAAGELAEAVRERLRAVVRDLEERGVLDPRPGRTADEAAGTAGVALPSVADGLRHGARAFDEIWYGRRPATRADCEALAALDRTVAAARPAPVPATPATDRFTAVPR